MVAERNRGAGAVPLSSLVFPQIGFRRGRHQDALTDPCSHRRTHHVRFQMIVVLLPAPALAVRTIGTPATCSPVRREPMGTAPRIGWGRSTRATVAFRIDRPTGGFVRLLVEPQPHPGRQFPPHARA